MYPVVGSSSSSTAARARTIFVGDLSYFCTEEDLFRLFASAGNILHVSIARRGETSLMYGFVELDSLERAERISEEFNGHFFMGRNLRIFALGKYTGPALSFPNFKPESYCVHVSFATHNLHKVINEEVLRTLFNTIGEVVDIAIRRYYRQRHRQYGYAFVEFFLRQSAEAAAEMWKEKEHDGVCIKCTIGHRVSGESANQSTANHSSNSKLKQNQGKEISCGHQSAAATVDEANPVLIKRPLSQVGYPVQMTGHSQHSLPAYYISYSTIPLANDSHFHSQPAVQATFGDATSNGHFVTNNQHAVIGNNSNFHPQGTQHTLAMPPAFVSNPTSSPNLLAVGSSSSSSSYVPVMYSYPPHLPHHHQFHPQQPLSLPHQPVYVTNAQSPALQGNYQPVLVPPMSHPQADAQGMMSACHPTQIQYVMVSPNQQPFDGQSQAESKQQHFSQPYPVSSMYL